MVILGSTAKTFTQPEGNSGRNEWQGIPRMHWWQSGNEIQLNESLFNVKRHVNCKNPRRLSSYACNFVVNLSSPFVANIIVNPFQWLALLASMRHCYFINGLMSNISWFYNLQNWGLDVIRMLLSSGGTRRYTKATYKGPTDRFHPRLPQDDGCIKCQRMPQRNRTVSMYRNLY
jgi:hypothetical protein